MADSLENPLVAFKFGLEIEGKLAGYFTTVGGIGSESEVVEHKISDPDTGETIIQKIPGRLTWTEVTLKRGVTSNIDVWDWRNEVVTGKVDDARTNCSIVAYNQANEEIARWNFENAWPSKVTGPEMDSGSQEYMVEEMVIVHEGMYRES
jgi:phage tail-like protein